MSDYGLLDAALEGAESDYEVDQELTAFLESDAERRKPVARRPVPTGRGTGYYRPRVPNNFVTQAQLQAAMARIGKDVKANAAGIKSVGARVDAVAAEQRKQSETMRKDTAERKKELAKLKSNMQLAALLPLLTSKSLTIANSADLGGTTIPAGTKLSIAPDGIGLMLPLLLMGDGGLGGGGDSGNTLLLALAVSGGL